MTVRAKFYISELTQYPGAAGGKVKLGAATRGARNADWASATPSGTLELNINNPAAFDFFVDLLARSKDLGFAPEVDIIMSASGDMEPHAFEPFERANHYVNGRCAACGGDQDAPLHTSA